MATFKDLITEMDQNIRKMIYAWDKQTEAFKALSENEKENVDYQKEVAEKDFEKQTQKFFDAVSDSMHKAENYIKHLTPEKFEKDINQLVDNVNKQVSKVSEDMETQFKQAQDKISEGINKANSTIQDETNKSASNIKMQEANLKFKMGLNYLGEALKSFQDALSTRFQDTSSTNESTN